MAGRLGAAIAALTILLAGAASLGAQIPGEYSFELSEDGAPHFTQVLRWRADPNVLFYRVTLETSAGETISTWQLETAEIEAHLRPGAYRYRIAAYNALGKLEAESNWKDISVREAILPRVASVSPKAWFLEDLKPELILTGEGLVAGATVELRREGASSGVIGKEVERAGESTLRVSFPRGGLAAGDYTLVLTNPGGLSVSMPHLLSIRYERPLDLLVAVGFAPWIPLYDAWYTEAWSESIFPQGFSSRISAYFVKRPFGYIGAECFVTGRIMQGGEEGAVIDSQVGTAGLGAVYRRPMAKNFSVALRTGGGVALTHLAFDYDGESGSELSSLDPYVSVGGSVLYFITERFFLDSGIEWMHIFTRGFSEGGLLPSLSVGMLL